ncbi:TIGR00282 family metallophosphoesterase [Flexistipes sinusarabici]|uniref:TIGR00282 family metallophosphoesterase n=1 Tax=Flexistipes sinusarabici TaxID=2352 RepID=UPI002355C8F1|nr:TIGR00282 family metallophosphoesterase [Flexistipes sinusarabici]
MRNNKTLEVLFIGDIVGRSGRRSASLALKELSETASFDLVIANVENSASGFGITLNVYKELRKLGIDFMTSGNHIWDKKDTEKEIEKYENVIRPANYPDGVPGIGFKTLETEGVSVCISNFMGRVFMPVSDCPFRSFDRLYENQPDAVHLVDFHGEATSEKMAFGLYTDSRAAAVCCTHTHVQTNDDRILPKGTFYISDVGMCGSADSVIGTTYEKAMKRFLYSMPAKFDVEKKGTLIFNAVNLSIDKTTKKVVHFEKIKKYYGE